MGDVAPSVPHHRLIRLRLNGVLLCEAGRLRRHGECRLMNAAATATQDRTCQIKFWATPEERAALLERAAKAGLSLRAYLISVGLGRDPDSDSPPRRPAVTGEKRERIFVRASPLEKAAIEQSATRAGLSVTAFMVAASMGTPVKSVVDLDQVARLARINADQGRLGGLLKLWLSMDGRFVPGYPDRSHITSLLDEIRLAQEMLRAAIRRIVDSH